MTDFITPISSHCILTLLVGTTSSPRYICRARKGRHAGHKEFGTRRICLRREAHLCREPRSCERRWNSKHRAIERSVVKMAKWGGLAAGVLGGLDEIFIKPGAKVLYLGAASGTSVSHVADIVGPTGTVFAVEFSHRSGRDLINMATHRTNVIPIIEDARHPLRYRMLVSMVDVIFADVAQPDQARIVGLNAHLFLKVGGGVVVSIKANCIDSTAAPEAVFAREVQKMREERIKPLEQLTLGMVLRYKVPGEDIY